MVAVTPVDWIPLMVAAAIRPDSTGSSLKLSKPLPPRGDLCMLTVGPRITDAPFAMDSAPCSAPPFWMRSISQVAPSPVPHGRQAAGTPLKNLVPRTPFGPSETRIEGTPRREMGAVCQKSIPTAFLSFCSPLLLGFAYLTTTISSRPRSAGQEHLQRQSQLPFEPPLYS